MSMGHWFQATFIFLSFCFKTHHCRYVCRPHYLRFSERLKRWRHSVVNTFSFTSLSVQEKKPLSLTFHHLQFLVYGTFCKSVAGCKVDNLLLVYTSAALYVKGHVTWVFMCVMWVWAGSNTDMDLKCLSGWRTSKFWNENVVVLL